MSLLRTGGALVVIVVAYMALVFTPADLPPKYEAAIYTFAALVAFGAVAWLFVPTRKR
jgi:hypothetical protein